MRRTRLGQESIVPLSGTRSPAPASARRTASGMRSSRAAARLAT